MDETNGPGAGPPAVPKRRRRNHALWIGPLAVFLGAVSYFLIFSRFPALRDFPWINLPVVAAGIGLSALAAWRAYLIPERFRGRILGAVGVSFALLVGSLFVAYVFYVSYMLPAPSEVTLSLTTAPDFSLEDEAGRTVRLADFRGSKLIVSFYRGFW